MIKRVKRFKPTKVRFEDDNMEFILEYFEDHNEHGVALRDYHMYTKKGIFRPKVPAKRKNVLISRIVTDFGCDFMGRQNREIHKVHDGYFTVSPQKNVTVKRLLDEHEALKSQIAHLEGTLALTREAVLTTENQDKFAEREMERAEHSAKLREKASIDILNAATSALRRTSK